MQHDATRGVNAPIEPEGDAWQREPDVGHRGARSFSDEVKVGLTAVILSVRQERPVALVSQATARLGPDRGWQLPTGRFLPLEQSSLDAALRDVVQDATGRDLGYVEQLLTDYGPAQGTFGENARQLSVSYLALTRADSTPLDAATKWLDCYELLPWEDFRGGRPATLTHRILPSLDAWCNAIGEAGGDRTVGAEAEMSRRERVSVSFGLAGRSWDDQRVVDRFDLIAEAGLLPDSATSTITPGHMRLIAAGLGRLRAKIRYRPVVFELLPPEFTLFELQRAVEAVLGPTLHKQNFRRLVEGTGLVEPTGDVRNNTGGRPAKTFRFRREVLLERPAPGVHVRTGRAA